MRQATSDETIARLGRQIRLACRLEATARKPGNVHPQAAFEDLCYADFVASAEAAAPVLSQSAQLGVGRAVLEAVRRTRQAVDRNTNLGTVLLLAPLAAVPPQVSLQEGITAVLAQLNREDASLVYRAIRLAEPGGMGEVDTEAISREPTVTLLEAMQLAARRDAVAAQYAGRFDLVLNVGVAYLRGVKKFSRLWEQAVIGLHLDLMARTPDTLIARKCGLNVAAQSAERARAVLEAGWPQTAEGQHELAALDRWLREDGHRRNPGTTADLVAACLFAAFRENFIQEPADPVECSRPAVGRPAR